MSGLDWSRAVSVVRCLTCRFWFGQRFVCLGVRSTDRRRWCAVVVGGPSNGHRRCLSSVCVSCHLRPLSYHRSLRQSSPHTSSETPYRLRAPFQSEATVELATLPPRPDRARPPAHHGRCPFPVAEGSCRLSGLRRAFLGALVSHCSHLFSECVLPPLSTRALSSSLSSPRTLTTKTC